ncbi:hypothetical protein FQN60_006499, partial [Etheostoma spectabile]
SVLLRVQQHWSPNWRPCSATSPGIWTTASPSSYVAGPPWRTSAPRRGTAGWVTSTTCGGSSSTSWVHEDAQSLFSKAAEAFRKTKRRPGSWLVVNYGDLAWLHHHLGDRAESQATCQRSTP